MWALHLLQSPLTKFIHMPFLFILCNLGTLQVQILVSILFLRSRPILISLSMGSEWLPCFLWLRLAIQPFWNISQGKCHPPTLLAQESLSIAFFPSCYFPPNYWEVLAMFICSIRCFLWFSSDIRICTQWIYCSVEFSSIPIPASRENHKPQSLPLSLSHLSFIRHWKVTLHIISGRFTSQALF